MAIGAEKSEIFQPVIITHTVHMIDLDRDRRAPPQGAITTLAGSNLELGRQ